MIYFKNSDNIILYMVIELKRDNTVLDQKVGEYCIN